MQQYKNGNNTIEEIQSFKFFCKTRLGYSRQKWFHQGRYASKKLDSEAQNPTFVNEKTQLLWKMWKAMRRENWETYAVSNTTY